MSIKSYKKDRGWPYRSSIWPYRTLQMSLINCEVDVILTSTEKCVLSNDKKATTFAITKTKLCVQL